MRRSKIRAYVHFVWATMQRLPMITDEIEPSLYRCIQDEAQRLNCDVLAIGGTSNHVHLLIFLASTVSFSQFMQQVKGSSSRFVREEFNTEFFGWQEGYAAFTISRNHVGRVRRYVDNQKQHHSDNTLWADWEETDEPKSP